MTVPAVTAEWNCARCGASNRKLVSADTTETIDRCNHCKAIHVVRPGPRPIRWDAVLK
jgi:DNA-directed RNA polymerase subunit RPC12/RpoP